MTLEELITTLEAADPTLVLPHGFTNPHSYRGYYDDLAFEPATNVPVTNMLADARSALGTTFTGWKGGEFTMRGYTDCWLAQEGSAGGETLGPLLLQFMLAAGIRDAARTASGQQPTATPGARTTGHQPGTRCGRLLAGQTPGTWTDCDLPDGHDGPHTARQTTGQQPKPAAAYSDGKGRAYCLICATTTGADVPLAIDSIDPQESCAHCQRYVADVALQTTGQTDSEPDPTTADDPVQLRWGLGDVLHGDDDTVIVCLSGPAPDRAPYWLELEPEQRDALRDDLAQPAEVQTVLDRVRAVADEWAKTAQRYPDSRLSTETVAFVLRTALAAPAVGQPADCRHPDGYEGECPCTTACGCCNTTPAPPAEDRVTVYGIGINEWDEMQLALRRIEAAVGQPAEAQAADEARPPRSTWRVEGYDADEWNAVSCTFHRSEDAHARKRVSQRYPDMPTRVVRETTTWTVEDER